MKTTSVTLLLSFILSISLLAQDSDPIVYDFNPRELDVSEVELGSTKLHPFGDVITKKLKLFRERYTYTEAATPTSPTAKTVIHKPGIYNPIMKIDRTLKKNVKKGLAEKEVSIKDLEACLDVALVCSSSNTIELEKRLKAAKTPEGMIEVFKAVVLE